MKLPAVEWLDLGYYSVPIFFVGTVLLLGLAATPLFRAADTPPIAVKHRVVSLDGLRGLLALAVVFHHLAIYHGFLETGAWKLPPSSFYTLLGPFGVSIFFMITGYLFWGRLLREKGRVNWRALYTGRLFRIGPLFIAAALALLALVLARTGLHRLVPGRVLADELGRWLSLGFLLGRSLNGLDRADLLLAGVTWSVQWEWWFYLSLPVLALVARQKRAQLPAPVALLLGSVILGILRPDRWSSVEVLPYCNLFLAGMLCASAEGRLPIRAKLPEWVRSTLLLVCCAAGFWRPGLYSWTELFCFGMAFYLVTSGSTLFGLLVTRAARRLGDISYGLYLLQGLAMDAVFRPRFVRAFALSSPLHHWLLGMVSCVFLLVLATAAHVWIERPGIALGRRLARRWTEARKVETGG